MNLFPLKGFNNVSKIKIFGERNTGTIYLEKLLQKNLKINILNYNTLGWKHRLSPTAAELKNTNTDGIIFLVLSKNPYAWLKSMHRKPYHFEHLKQLTFKEFITTPFGDYQNPIIMWNTKYQSYLDLAQQVPNISFIRYEDLLADPDCVLDNIAQKFAIKKSLFWFSDITNTLTNHHGTLKNKFHKSYYTHEKWQREFTPEIYTIVNSYLDTKIMNTLNYNIMEYATP